VVIFGYNLKRKVMEEKREIKELLRLILDNIDLMAFGLCGLYIRLHGKGLISYEESLLIEEYFNKNKPDTINSYWFPECLREPRIEWLQNQIKQLEQ
jgi:hypothetical protein